MTAWEGKEARRPRGTSDVLGLAGFLALNLLVLAAGGVATARSVEIWYPSLAKPGFTPPAWVFGPVWTVLFFLMAIAGWRIWRRFGAPGRGPALLLYLGQLGLNLLWSVLFFGFQAPGVALLEILLLLFFILAATMVFAPIDRLAAAC
ncbi:MAG TPA: TspO/MBR family protein, partial [Gammaproteobacteria bacterium]|nr:TspO/MBR family protein [Gammaproteobacteria bacterium]